MSAIDKNIQYDDWKLENDKEQLDCECAYCGEPCDELYCSKECKKAYEHEN